MVQRLTSSNSFVSDGYVSFLRLTAFFKGREDIPAEVCKRAFGANNRTIGEKHFHRSKQMEKNNFTY